MEPSPSPAPLTPELRRELEKFPTALRTLIEAELAAGNTIEEIGHSHPAPPAGAYLKFGNKISTRARASGDGLKFYERNSSIYCGEFTDEQRFYFVIEAPNPPPPEPDMDAIRKAHEPQPGEQFHYPSARDVVALGERLQLGVPTPPSTHALTQRDYATGAEWTLHFRDQRPPHEVQFALEQRVMTLFTPSTPNEGWCVIAKATVVGAAYDFELRFTAALPTWNCYSLRVACSWAEHSATHHDYFRKTSASWFAFWSRELMAAGPPDLSASSSERYQALCSAALQAEAHLDSIAAIQQAILTGMRRGGRYGNSHKEGGTNIFWRGGRFVRSDYGDCPAHEEFAEEGEFLRMLWNFLQMEVTRSAGKEGRAELDTWRLIWRCMREG